MHGFGARILQAIPKTSPGSTARELRSTLDDGVHKCPSLGTIRTHLHHMRILGMIRVERDGVKWRYVRLVDSVLDAFRPATEVEA